MNYFDINNFPDDQDDDFLDWLDEGADEFLRKQAEELEKLKKQPKKCTCPLPTLMSSGCICGGF